jgi:Carboxypeptidase regulatory-like domain
MFSRLTRVPLILSVILIAPSAVVFAQSARIAGVVRDGIGGVIPGVSVTTIPQSGGLLRHTTSGSDGSYRFDGLPDGTYRVDFDLRGFELVRRNHVRVSRDAEANIDVVLHPRMICECMTLEPPSPWAQRPGQVVDKSGRPLPHARIQLVGREEAYTDNEGRFFIRVPVFEQWPLTASDTGFRSVTEQVSGADSATVVLSLEYEDTTGVPDVQRFGRCECPVGYLLPYGGR